MKKNMGNADRVLRLVLGIIVIGLGIFFKSWWGLIGLIPLFTSVCRYCPLYVPFKISTEKTES